MADMRIKELFALDIDRTRVAEMRAAMAKAASEAVVGRRSPSPRHDRKENDISRRFRSPEKVAQLRGIKLHGPQIKRN